MAEFAYNKAKNASTGHTLFELNCGFYSQVLYKKNIDFHSKSYSANKLIDKLRKLIKIYYQNLFYIQKLRKKANNKRVKNRSYILDKKV